MSTLNKEVVEEWIKVLESDEYKQGKTYLRRTDGTFCCLGVLCDMYAKKHNKEWQLIEGTYHFIDAYGQLPSEVMKWSGLCPYGPLGLDVGVMNDHGASFKDIAQALRKHLNE